MGTGTSDAVVLCCFATVWPLNSLLGQRLLYRASPHGGSSGRDRRCA
ncbi:hypothetical protein [Streptomyces filipinensis]|nr:hypothetical protein [Streptomyces filipinensis]